MSTYSTDKHETYIGRNELILYLNKYKNKTFRGFLHRCREVIVTSSMSCSADSDWLDLDNSWATHFLYEAEQIDKNNFDVLKDKVNEERSQRLKNLESYWKNVIKECEIRRDISKYKAERDRLLQTLSDIDEKLQFKTSKLMF